MTGQTSRVLIVDTHPVQYRAPLYRELERRAPGIFEVFYGADFSVRGYRDQEFGQTFAWDLPMLDGYNASLRAGDDPHGAGARRELALRIGDMRPSAVLLTDVQGPLFRTALWAAWRCGAALWLRCETQDEAFVRSSFRAALRSACYRMAYPLFRGFFPIGVLNREHYLRHGVPARKLHRAPYATVDPFSTVSPTEMARSAAAMRLQLGVGENERVVAFFGKLIPKKDPALLFHAVSQLPADLRRRLVLLFVGSGELQKLLSHLAVREEAAGGARSLFAGFVNQSKLPDYYLATDILVLPSQRAGETWGLVVNEALHAGCGVVVSEAVGCSREFGHLARVRVIDVGAAGQLATELGTLLASQRDFTWSRRAMEDYSLACAADGIVAALANTR